MKVGHFKMLLPIREQQRERILCIFIIRMEDDKATIAEYKQQHSEGRCKQNMEERKKYGNNKTEMHVEITSAAIVKMLSPRLKFILSAINVDSTNYS